MPWSAFINKKPAHHQAPNLHNLTEFLSFPIDSFIWPFSNKIVCFQQHLLIIQVEGTWDIINKSNNTQQFVTLLYPNALNPNMIMNLSIMWAHWKFMFDLIFNSPIKPLHVMKYMWMLCKLMICLGKRTLFKGLAYKWSL